MPGRQSLHPLCCIPSDCHVSPPPTAVPVGSDANAGTGSEIVVAGVLYKWTNYGKGWRSRWFSIRNGVISYSKIRRRNVNDDITLTESAADVRLIGVESVRFLKAEKKAVGVVNLKVSSFRESKSDERRFYIFSSTKTLHLRTSSCKDRALWIEALVSVRSVYSLRFLSESISFFRNDVSFSTDKLRDHMHNEGLGEALIKDCEQIMLSEFLEFQRQIKIQYEEQFSFLGPFQQHSEEVNLEDDPTTIHGGQLQLMKQEFSSSSHGKYSEYSTTESPDDIEKHEYEDFSDEDVSAFFDTKERFSDYDGSSSPLERFLESVDNDLRSKIISCDEEVTHTEDYNIHHSFPHVERRNTLPEPIEREKGVSLWSMIKDNVGKDLTRVCLPVYFNEPLSSLQKCFEELECSYLLDRAYEYGKMGNSLMRILNVAAFAVSGYASSDGRHRKPFNPLLGETYEADYPEKGVRFISEKVSHGPMVIACHCEGKGWKFWGDSNLRSKFWGRSIQLDPVGVLTLEFDDGEIFTWSKVTTNIYNLILGKLYCDHHGIMNIKGNRQHSCKLKFKEQSLMDRNPRQVQGFVEDLNGMKVASLMGKWDDNMYCTIAGSLPKDRCFSNQTQNDFLLWKRSNPPAKPTQYNLSSFAITLNELKPELKEKLPPTDSRLRPDQRHLENGEYEKANAEKLRLEQRQRMSRKLQESGWKPRWFQRDREDGTFRYVGGYWEAREHHKWDGCPNIYGEVSDDHTNSSNNSANQ